jgi:uncharacterized protein (TIGR02271 family)
MTSQERHVLGQHREHDERTVRREEPEAAVVQLREEELAARKQKVEVGRVSLGTEVVQDEKTLEVPVTREEVSVERHRVDRHPSDEPIAASAEVIRVPVREDQVAVDKQAVIYEEVNVAKRAVEDTQRVSDSVRKEVVDVDWRETA